MRVACRRAMVKHFPQCIFLRALFYSHFAFGSAFVHIESHGYILCSNRFPQMPQKFFYYARARLCKHTIDSNRDAANVELVDIAISPTPFVFATIFYVLFLQSNRCFLFLLLSVHGSVVGGRYCTHSCIFRGGEILSSHVVVVVSDTTVELFTVLVYPLELEVVARKK